MLLALIFRLLFATVGRFSLFFGFLMTFHFSARDRVKEEDSGTVAQYKEIAGMESASESEVRQVKLIRSL